MKNTFFALIVAICLCLTACVSDSGSELTYTPDATTEQADRMFGNNAESDLINLCKVMAGNNDHAAERDNYFNYVLAKMAEIDMNNDSDKYEMCLNIISTCLDQPLTQAHVIGGLKQIYLSIDTKLTEETKQYMTGKWLRIDRTTYSGMQVEVTQSEESGFCSRITALPEGSNSAFRIGDIKWNDIQFANHKKFYMHDLVAEESGATTYYKNNSKTVSKLKGTTATIDFEKDTIYIKYDSASGVTTGSSQTWVKVGSDSEAAYRAGTYYEQPEQEEAAVDETMDTGSETAGTSVMDEYSLSTGTVTNTTTTATTVIQ